MTQLRNAHAHAPAEEGIVVFERGEWQRFRNLNAPALGALLAHDVHLEKRGVAHVPAASNKSRSMLHHARLLKAEASHFRPLPL